MHSISARSGNEVRRRRPTKAPIHRAAFAEQRPLGNSMAAAASQYVFEQLHRGRNSEHVLPFAPTCTERTSVSHYGSFIYLGTEFMPLFLDVKTLLGRRHASLGFHSAI